MIGLLSALRCTCAACCFASSSGAVEYYLFEGVNGVAFEASDGRLSTSPPQTIGSGWHHVAATNVGNAFTLYLDGHSVLTGTATIQSTATATFGLGATVGLGDDIDDVRLYNRALTAAEIQARYAAVGPH